MKKHILLFWFAIQNLFTFGQDVHFTMFHAAPTVLNPAAAGIFNGTFRATANYRSQWRSVTNKPFTTYSLTTDGSLYKNGSGNGYMGIGLSAYRDIAGQSGFGTTKINLTGSGIIKLDNYTTLSIGLNAGWGQQTIAPGELQWDSQFDGQNYNSALSSGENLNFANKSFFDVGTGIVWSYGTGASNMVSYDKFSATVGLAYHHAARPKLQTYNYDQQRMYSRIVLHGDMNFAQQYSRLAIQPRFFAMFQGPSIEVNLGMMARYLISDGSKYTGNIKGMAIAFGGYYRVADAFSPSIEFEIAGFSLGYSYDFNHSSLRNATNSFGGSEVYIRFQNPNPFFQFSRRPRLR